jgi:opacity protein-like surface antigen
MRALFRTSLLVLTSACLAPAFADEARDDARDCRVDWHSSSDFAWQVQVDAPVKDLGRALDQRTGLGLGMQWTSYRSGGAANRTRLEWNVFPEGNPVGTAAVATKASNYVLSFDRLYHVSGTRAGVYVVAGLGAVRWFTDQTPGANPTVSTHTTKLAVTAGAGYRFNRAVSLEARYLVSSVNRTFDGNVAQGVLSMRF